jgi:aminoglycoside phosphotransferase family enzyme/predicted kinase
MAIDQIVSVEQGETIAFLMEALARETGAPVETMETHVSLIFLAGELVFKLKRAVAFPYLDFSTPAKREAACRAEIALNSRAAPELYLGLRAITREKDGLAFNGVGEKHDCIVVMRRFHEADLFDAMARDHRLTPGHIEALAETLARFHAGAERFPHAEGAAAMAHLLDLNDQSFEQCDIFPPESVRRLEKKFHDELTRIAPLLDARAAQGFIRLCHGDLYLRNICLFEGKPTLFDCIEFDEALARIDVLYDVAFTLMDLWLCGRRDLANLLYNRYASALTRTLGDMPARIRDGYATLPFFMALRAGIRAHIAAGQARSGHGRSAQAHEDEARAYFELAEDLLEPRPKILVAIGGLSGSGKSTLAAALAPEIGFPPGARTLNSDRTRKAMHRLRPDEKLPPEAYALNITSAVYLRLLSRAMDALSQQRAVIMDAVYSMEAERNSVEKLAREAGVPLLGLWLDADPDVLRRRVRERPKGASDADIAVLERQLTLPTGNISWIRLDATAPDLVSQALALAKQVLAGAEGPKS